MPPGKSATLGFTLVEILVSIAITGIGFLALGQLFLVTSQVGTESLHRTLAHVQAIDMGERLWLDLTDPDATVSEWTAQHTGALPGWDGGVVAAGADDPNLYNVTIAWAGTLQPEGNASYLIRTPTVSP